jgi:hypothetical protein
MTVRRIGSAVVIAALAAMLGGAALGCKREGPAERAGKKMDHVKDKVDDTINPKGPVEKAGRAIDRAVNDND